MLLGAIDIGSNAVRLFFSNVFEQDGQIVVEKASLMRIPLRLGDDVFTQNAISEPKIKKLVKTMKAFGLLIEVNEPVAYRACATSAMREAHNREDILKRIDAEANIKIQIIDGVEEAQIVSAVQNLSAVKDYKHTLYIDVGGGSTELSIISKKGLLASNSFKIGTVRMLSEKINTSEWDSMRDWLLKFKDIYSDMLFVGAGGNINKIAKLYGRVPDQILPFTNLEYALNHLQRFSLAQRIDIMGLRPDRADVIVPAARIFHFIMQTTNAPKLLVPKIGLSDGIVSVLYNAVKNKQAGK
jgi:exopolyphosphatase/guanosine-5'-triphosphate,3'-diphosphate pyrophosphatase